MEMKLEITLSMLDAHLSIQDAIEAACDGHDTLSSGIVGSSFSTSGPGAGWSRQHGASDFAERALDGEDGSLGYIDSSDGRMATMEDGEIVWSDETVVEVVDDNEDVSEATLELLESAVESGHVVSDVTTRCPCPYCGDDGCGDLATHYDSDSGKRVCVNCLDPEMPVDEE
jgi:hypothetical protein